MRRRRSAGQAWPAVIDGKMRGNLLVPYALQLADDGGRTARRMLVADCNRVERFGQLGEESAGGEPGDGAFPAELDRHGAHDEHGRGGEEDHRKQRVGCGGKWRREADFVIRPATLDVGRDGGLAPFHNVKEGDYY